MVLAGRAARIGEGSLEVDAFRLGLGTAGVTLMDSGEEAVVVTDGSVGEPYPQGIVGIRQLLRYVTAVGPGGVRVGGTGGESSVAVVRVVARVVGGGVLVLVPMVGQQ